ncbi:MAG: hypothetical protein M3460_26350 [Actinomycetota bacterium]|nr:hypothetical protein [Actinomycetota bacterium]
MGRVCEIHRLRWRVRVVASDPLLTAVSGMAEVTKLVDRLGVIRLLRYSFIVTNLDVSTPE